MTISPDLNLLTWGEWISVFGGCMWSDPKKLVNSQIK